MKLISVFDLQNMEINCEQLQNFLAGQQWGVFTEKGKPIALVVPLADGNFEEIVKTVRQVKAVVAFQSMRAHAATEGFLTEAEIKTEIAAARQMDDSTNPDINSASAAAISKAQAAFSGAAKEMAVSSEFDIQALVDEVRCHENQLKETAYMTEEMARRKSRKEGYEKGYAEGYEEGREEIRVLSVLAFRDLTSEEDLARRLNMPVKQVREIISLHESCR